MQNKDNSQYQKIILRKYPFNFSQGSPGIPLAAMQQGGIRPSNQWNRNKSISEANLLAADYGRPYHSTDHLHHQLRDPRRNSVADFAHHHHHDVVDHRWVTFSPSFGTSSTYSDLYFSSTISTNSHAFPRGYRLSQSSYSLALPIHRSLVSHPISRSGHYHFLTSSHHHYPSIFFSLATCYLNA